MTVSQIEGESGSGSPHPRPDYTRRVARTVSTFLVAPHFLQDTNYVLTIIARVAVRVAGTLDLVVCRPPIDLPTFHVSLGWHRSTEDDPVLTWVRERVVELAAKP